ncbi:MAG: hypothetical protein QXG39_02605 [Candidatus Aenigmatarchaeota archaeon]
MTVTYSYIMKMSKKEIIENLSEIKEYLNCKREFLFKLKKRVYEMEIMINDVERKLKMVGVDVHKL